MGLTPYELFYGKNILLPIEFEVKTLRTATKLSRDLLEAQRNRLLQINKLDELRQEALQYT